MTTRSGLSAPRSSAEATMSRPRLSASWPRRFGCSQVPGAEASRRDQDIVSRLLPDVLGEELLEPSQNLLARIVSLHVTVAGRAECSAKVGIGGQSPERRGEARWVLGRDDEAPARRTEDPRRLAVGVHRGHHWTSGSHVAQQLRRGNAVDYVSALVEQQGIRRGQQPREDG